MDWASSLAAAGAGAGPGCSTAGLAGGGAGVAGGTAVYDTSVLGRCLRDAHVVTQHIMTAPKLNETLGKVLLGLDAETTML